MPDISVNFAGIKSPNPFLAISATADKFRLSDYESL